MPTGIPGPRPIFSRGHDRLCRDHRPLRRRRASSASIDCIFPAWITDAPRGFADAESPICSAWLPSGALRSNRPRLLRISRNAGETYLGRDPARAGPERGGSRRAFCRKNRGRAVVQRSARLYAHLRHRRAGADHSAARRLCRGTSSPPCMSRAAMCLKLIGDGMLAIFRADDRQQACRSALAARARRRARRRTEGASARRQILPDHPHLSWPSCGRSLLRQFRQQEPPRLHRRRAGGERGQPHRGAVPLGRAEAADLLGLRCGAGSQAARGWSPSAAMRCAASDAPRICSRSTACPRRMWTHRANASASRCRDRPARSPRRRRSGP